MAILNMYKVFPEKKYLEMAISIGDSLIEKQEKNGGWKGKTSANELAGFSRMEPLGFPMHFTDYGI